VTSFQISLDGPAAIHNQSRLRADGKATFDVLWNNLTQIAALAKQGDCPSFTIRLRIHYDRHSATELSPLVDAIIEELLPSGCFLVSFHQIEKLGGRNDDKIALASKAEHEVIRALAARINASTRTKYAQVAEDTENFICYAAKANSFVLRADGRLAKCTVALNDKRNEIGHLNLDGTIQVNNERFTPWLRGLFSGDPDTLACPLHGMDNAIN
ncbi:MAG: radical SAM domain-containing protein, partial [Cyanobacteriota bacterium]|nr:radical SAM domain-containing protein [Cyanobacteriota bacterium]